MSVAHVLKRRGKGPRLAEWNGKRYVMLDEREYDELSAAAAARAAARRAGTVPAIAYARESLARKVIAARRKLRWSQTTLAKHAGLRVETINRLEKGHHTPDTATVIKIDRALRSAGA